MAVYTGSNVAQLTQIASNDNYGYPYYDRGALTFTATAGQTYFIAVDSRFDQTGSVQLNWNSGAIQLPPSITSASSVRFPLNAVGSFKVQARGTPPAALTCSGSLPAGVTFVDNGNGTATLKGYYLAGSQHFTLTANNGTSPNATQVFTMSGT